jgi:hypothetical protein
VDRAGSETPQIALARADGELFATGRVLTGYDVWQATVKRAKIAGKDCRSRSTRRTAGPAAKVPIEAGPGNDENYRGFCLTVVSCICYKNPMGHHS